jgi:lipopolysaccharide transport system ATP-binding protein
MNWAIRITNLSKLYRVGGVAPLGTNLREDLVRWLRRSATQDQNKSNPNNDGSTKQDGAAPEGYFWALRDIDIEVARGEVLGIIGRNGAGKSTLLKILSRITPPTAGTIQYRGRLASLLEIGTGFHRELTGRENIFLNGSILGMRRHEVFSKLDEIIAFAEVDKFVDTPVKFYSSGMYVRLAFAVAAHLNTDILLVDEVLAVGDVRFQKKCLGKMHAAASVEGRTVVFVSHNMNAVQRLCSRGVFLHEGRIAGQGNAGDIVRQYLSACGSQTAASAVWIDLSDAGRFGTGEVRFSSVRYRSDLEEARFQPYSEGPIEFSLVIISDAEKTVGSLAVTFYTLDGVKLVNADTVSQGKLVELREGRNDIRLRIKQLHLKPGNYLLGLYLAGPLGVVLDHLQPAFEITVVDLETNKLGRRPVYDGCVSCDFEVMEVKDDVDRRAHG